MRNRAVYNMSGSKDLIQIRLLFSIVKESGRQRYFSTEDEYNDLIR